ncbi:MAG: cell division control protein Cdc6, partial [candidate division Zixibacteria bacterium]|nr:cell division control protein Cdc6 [candidate division Zixibacteria bacterium]
MVLDDGLDARVKSSMGSEMLVFSSYSRKELGKILESRVEDAFVEGVLENGVVDFCAELVAEKGGDARKAVDLLRVSGEIANEKGSKVTRGCVEAALRRVEKDWVHDLLMSLAPQTAVVAYLLAFVTARTEKKITTREIYDVYKKAELEKGMKKVGERRVLEIINELETIGLISTW